MLDAHSNDLIDLVGDNDTEGLFTRIDGRWHVRCYDDRWRPVDDQLDTWLDERTYQLCKAGLRWYPGKRKGIPPAPVPSFFYLYGPPKPSWIERLRIRRGMSDRTLRRKRLAFKKLVG